MDPADSFFQALDSEQLLKEHGRSLVADARELLRQDPQAKVAGMITMPDSPDAPAIRDFLAKMTGQAPPNGLLVGDRWDEKAGLQARYPSVPINNELYWLNGGQP